MDDATIVYGLGAIKGVGEAAIEVLIQAREQGGPFTSLFDLCRRLDLRKVNRRVLEALIRSGALDAWGIERAVLFGSLDKALQIGTQFHQNQSSGQMDLFSLLQEETGSTASEDYVEATLWTERERLEREKETLGFYLTGHPTHAYQEELKTYIHPIAELPALRTKKAMICGVVRGLRSMITKRGKKLFILSLEDATGQLDGVVFPEVLSALTPDVGMDLSGSMLPQSGQILVADGDLSEDSYTGGVRFNVTALYRMEEARLRFGRCLTLELNAADRDVIAPLKTLLKAHPGKCALQMQYTNTQAKGTMTLAPEWYVVPSEDLLQELRVLLGKERVWMSY
jgi:DNA polymerase-3 subunit alpha